MDMGNHFINSVKKVDQVLKQHKIGQDKCLEQ